MLIFPTYLSDIPFQGNIVENSDKKFCKINDKKKWNRVFFSGCLKGFWGKFLGSTYFPFTSVLFLNGQIFSSTKKVFPDFFKIEVSQNLTKSSWWRNWGLKKFSELGGGGELVKKCCKIKIKNFSFPLWGWFWVLRGIFKDFMYFPFRDSLPSSASLQTFYFETFPTALSPQLESDKFLFAELRSKSGYLLHFVTLKSFSQSVSTLSRL